MYEKSSRCLPITRKGVQACACSPPRLGVRSTLRCTNTRVKHHIRYWTTYLRKGAHPNPDAPRREDKCARARANARTSASDSTCSTAPAHTTVTCQTALMLSSFHTLAKSLNYTHQP